MRAINLENFLESSRDIGYSLNNAIADLIDNSIDANAKRISVNLSLNENRLGFYIVDDGLGMSDEELKKAMQLSCANPNKEREKGKLGKYGLGLKLSSFAFARILCVTSKTKNGKAHSYEWNLDNVTEDGFSVRKVTDFDLKKMYVESGTLVEWNNCDKLSNYNEHDYNESLATLSKYLGLTFGRLIIEKGLEISLNGILIEPEDPFYINEHTTITFPTTPLIINKSATIEVTAYVIANLKKQKDSLLEEQGFYIYRNKRLIEKAGWLGLFKANEVSKLARVKVDISNLHDKVVGVNINKTSINKVNPILKSSLKKTAEIARNKSLEYYRVKGKVLKKLSKKNNYEHIWLIRQIGDKKKLCINTNHPVIKTSLTKDALKIYKLLEDSIPLETILSFEKEFDFETGKNNSLYLEFGRRIMNDMLFKGMPKIEALEELSTIEPFSLDESLIEIIREEYEIG
jgi:HSP90 family molecular chaperone